MRRRQLLAAAGTIGLAGCADFSSINESTPASSFPPATPVWHLTPPYPFRFDGELTVADGAPRGWLLEDGQPKRVHVAGEVLDGGPVSVYFSRDQISQGRIPTATFETVSSASTFEESVAYPDGEGSFFFGAEQQTTIDLRIEVTQAVE